MDKYSSVAENLSGSSPVNIIAVDDEILALNGMERVIKNVLPDCSLACFDRAVDSLDYAKTARIDIAFLDINMSGTDGLTLAKHLVEIHSKTNIIYVTGYAHYALDSIKAHASDFLIKPITEEKVLSAMEQLRHPIDRSEVPHIITKGRLTLDIVSSQAFINGMDILLTQKEFALLLMFIQNEYKALNAKYLYENVWNKSINDDNTTLKKHISNLREKLKDSGYSVSVIRGEGYRLEIVK
ncbi:MAG: response regulator transcription factor [Oscillospiraceae bacterium]|nr:response regulator transcription factor [Oscillospiraceae bacterium]